MPTMPTTRKAYRAASSGTCAQLSSPTKANKMENMPASTAAGPPHRMRPEGDMRIPPCPDFPTREWWHRAKLGLCPPLDPLRPLTDDSFDLPAQLTAHVFGHA